MRKSHQFAVATELPTDEPAKRVTLTVTTPQGASSSFALNAGELRRLVRVALTGLGYTKIVRPWHGKRAGWENRIERKVQPAMQVIETFFPRQKEDAGSEAL